MSVLGSRILIPKEAVEHILASADGQKLERGGSRVSFDRVPRPVRLVVRQTNGPLAIVQDARSFCWIVNRKNGKVVRESFDGLDAAKQEASTLSSLYWPEAPSPKWTGPVTGVSAEKRFDLWAGR